jgi:type III restriction enzyme
MPHDFFERPILNGPYEYPARHWELDADGQPTHKVIEKRRVSRYITPVPKPKKRKDSGTAGKAEARGKRTGPQQSLILDEGEGVSTEQDQYDPTPIINQLRREVDIWRRIPDPGAWKVTPETQRLLQHWRCHKFGQIRPFFCQVEAMETLIWLTEVAPKTGKAGKGFLTHLENANAQSNPDLFRIALKLATGTGKTTVMAMLIAWQTINKVRRPNSKIFTRGFLVVAPGLTIKDRLRVLFPNDADSYYQSRELVPQDMLADLERAKIVVTNYHAFKLRERMDIAKGTRGLLQGRGEPIETLETEGQMVQRVMPDLMGMKNVLVINDEAHHCYREKAGEADEGELKGDDRKEADKNAEAARVWISGLEAVNRKLGISKVVDLSATPFFLRGSGYAEGTLFHWTMSDFSLMDAIECGIVKLPRVPVSDNIPGGEMPRFRNLWEHIGKRMPKKGRGKARELDPHSLPVELETALDALYGHYQQTFEAWAREGIPVPPCFILVCNNTATSKLVYDFIAGYEHPPGKDGNAPPPFRGKFPLFSNFEGDGNRRAVPRTLLIDSEQLESGDALDKNFREMAAGEIDRFRREIVERTGDRTQAENLTDADLLREVMNTVGKEGRLGASIRCVVSVSMLTEGWDANTVTHVLGVRAFGTQLLCEQVIGRALRRQSYDLNEDGLFNVEYADVLGVPFDFTAKPVVVKPQPPRPTVQVNAVRPDRDALEIRFPRVQGYRVELPRERLKAEFNDDSVLALTPALTGPSVTQNRGIIGETADLSMKHLEALRETTLLYHLTKRLVYTQWRDPGGEPEIHFFGQLKRITRQWLRDCLVCEGGTYPAQLMVQELADMACERITAGITRALERDEKPIQAILDPYNPEGSTRHVNFTTSKKSRWETDPRKSHLNWVILDSDWEAEFCRVAEAHPRVRAYAKNHNLGLEVPYLWGSRTRTYRPDFIVQVDDGRADPLNLVVEIKGFRGEDAKEKKATMEERWIKGVNHLGRFGRWAFVEFTEVFKMEADFEAKAKAGFDEMVRQFRGGEPPRDKSPG